MGSWSAVWYFTQLRGGGRIHYEERRDEGAPPELAILLATQMILSRQGVKIHSGTASKAGGKDASWSNLGE